MISNIIWGSLSTESNRERKGYLEAFRKLGVSQVFEADEGCIPLVLGQQSNARQLFLHPDPPMTSIPICLPGIQIPTACFQFDTFSKPEWRALWSSLFDYVFVFHPGYEFFFRKYDHARVVLLSHAIDPEQFQFLPERRQFDLGWVGTTAGPLYKTRRRLLPELASRYRVNEWEKRYDEAETPQVYLNSKIVVNFSRDDHSDDANIRCFEAMAAGALLVTSLPSELEAFGFKNGIHFVGYKGETELFSILDHFLRNEAACKRIAETGRSLVLGSHTYDRNAKTILETLDNDDGKYFAPARGWPEGKTDFIYFHYFCKRVRFKKALEYYLRLIKTAPHLSVKGAPLLLRCLQHHLGRKHICA